MSPEDRRIITDRLHNLKIYQKYFLRMKDSYLTLEDEGIDVEDKLYEIDTYLYIIGIDISKLTILLEV